MRAPPWVVLFLAVVAACDEAPVEEEPGVCSAQRTSTFPVSGRVPIDVLVVVDRTASMADDDPLVARGLAQLGAELDRSHAWLPDVHLAFVTSDLGVEGVDGCDGDGDGGRFQRAAACGIDGGFLRDVRGGEGTRARNYTGPLAEVLPCLGALPRSTCPVSQPIAAVTHALGGAPGTEGFRRPDAQLQVIVVTDGDDCSLVDPAAIAGDADEAAVDFRCFARGVTCTPAEPAAGGAHTDCEARHDLGLVDLERSRALAGNARYPARFAFVAGDATAVVTGPGVRLAPSCTGDGHTVGPAPRLLSMEDERTTVGLDACGLTDWGVLAEAFFPPITLGLPCWSGEILDTEPGVAGLQPACTGELLASPRPGAPLEVVGELRACDDPALAPDAPCLRWAQDPQQCVDGGWFVSVDVNGLDGHHYASVTCAQACALDP